MIHIPCTYCLFLSTYDKENVVCKKTGELFNSGNRDICDEFSPLPYYQNLVRFIRGLENDRLV